MNLKISTWSTGKKLVLILGVLFVVGMVADMNSSPAPTPAQQISEVKYQSARILAKSYVDKVPLKSPSTSKVDPTNPNLFEVSSYIDSQNGFGAMIRTYWSMKLEYTGADDQGSVETDANWKVVEFIWDGEKIK